MIKSISGYDIIGDIHGHAEKLISLLRRMDYSLINNVWKHSERKAIFVGDYIDRGPEIRETLHLVRNMVEADSAKALMGNHEFNALAYHTPNGNGGYLREHDDKNKNQHTATLEQFQLHPEEFQSFLEWMSLLPVTFETNEIRCVHACWDGRHIKQLNEIVRDAMTPEILQRATVKGDDYYLLFEEVLKGKEVELPLDTPPFPDKDGHLRHEIRIRWWLDPAGLTYHEYAINELPKCKTLLERVRDLKNPIIYGTDEKPVFFGHYWLEGEPQLMRDNVCCLDFSVAKGGYLAAYRWNGENRLSKENFVYV